MDVRHAIKNGFLNLGMQVFPVLSALLAVPFTLKAFGAEAFAIFSLGVTTIVLFNYLNFGVAQAATRSLAKRPPASDVSKTNQVFYSGAMTILAIGLLFAGLAYGFSAPLAEMTAGSGPMRPVAQVFFRGIGMASPLFLFIIYLRGCLESQQLFKVTAMNRAFLNSVIFLSPLGPALLGLGIEASLYVMVVAHLGSLVFLFAKTRQALGLGKRIRVTRAEIVDLLRAGGWMTLSSLAAMLLLYADRFIISTISGLTVAAYYLAAFDLVSRLSLIYGSLTAAFFPAIAQWKELGEDGKITAVLALSSKAMFLVMLVIVSGIAAVSRELLALWISADFAEHAAMMLSVLAFGIFFNAMSVTPQRALLAIGRERIVGLYVALQSILYVAASVAAVIRFGPMGACVAFVIRALLEYLVLSVILNRDTFKRDLGTMARRALPYAMLTLMSMAAALTVMDSAWRAKLTFLALLLTALPVVFYGFLLSKRERLTISERIKAARP